MKRNSQTANDTPTNRIAAQSHKISKQLRQRTSFVSSTEALGIIGTSRKTLCSWVRQGTIGAYKFGNAYFFDPAELADWIDARKL
ncbi:MAG: helix-turn-helix domain-containing protein [Silvibacterium sp.]